MKFIIVFLSILFVTGGSNLYFDESFEVGKSFQQENSVEIGEYIDLGLSVKWANMNVGATAPEEYGDYYAWAEIDSKSIYNWSTHKYCNGSFDTQTKYCNGSFWGKVDNKRILDLQDDVAHVIWGGKWRMPTSEECQELIDNCSWIWYGEGNSEFNGIAGFKVQSQKNGFTNKFIFLPANGYRSDEDLKSVGLYGEYWSSSLDISGSMRAFGLDFYYDSIIERAHYKTSGVNRCIGRSVRPVCK